MHLFKIKQQAKGEKKEEDNLNGIKMNRGV